MTIMDIDSKQFMLQNEISYADNTHHDLLLHITSIILTGFMSPFMI